MNDALTTAKGSTRNDAISLLYQVLRRSGDHHLAFARAEAYLHENPQLGIRFEMGLDYRRDGYKELGMYHFKFLHEQNVEEAGALHNLALLCADCDLPILSVKHYKGSIALGETLSAANLGFMYLNAGMSDEAKTLVLEAAKEDPHEAQVDDCLAEVSRRTAKEQEKQAEMLEKAEDARKFLVSMGLALTHAPLDLNGIWELPFGKITLSHVGASLTGTAKIAKKESLNALSSLLCGTSGYGTSVPGPNESVRNENSDFRGLMTGAVCKFDLAIDTEFAGPLRPIIGAGKTRSGFIVFQDGGKSGLYAELEGGNMASPQRVTKMVGRSDKAHAS